MGFNGRFIFAVCVIFSINLLLGILPTIVIDWISILIKHLLLTTIIVDLLSLVLHLLRVHSHGLSMLGIGKLVVSIVILILLLRELSRSSTRIHHHHLLLLGVLKLVRVHLINWWLVLHMMILYGTVIWLHHNWLLHLRLRLCESHWSWVLLLLLLLLYHSLGLLKYIAAI